MDKSFEGTFKEQKTPHSNWLPVADKDVPQPHPALVSHSRLVTDEFLPFHLLRVDCDIASHHHCYTVSLKLTNLFHHGLILLRSRIRTLLGFLRILF